jgi:hypothetical protein
MKIEEDKEVSIILKNPLLRMIGVIADIREDTHGKDRG